MATTLRLACAVVASILLITCSPEHPARYLFVVFSFVLSGGTWQHTARSREAQADLERACRRSGLSQKEIASAQGIDEAQWNRQRNGVMGQQPKVYSLTECPEVEAEWIQLRAQRHNLVVVTEDTLTALVTRLFGRKAMVRMGLRDEREEERSA